MVYSTYLGGSGANGEFGAGSIAVDGAGYAYITGYTASTDFPTKNPLQPTYGGGGYDAFVAKINAVGSALIYSTYLGGSGIDQGNGIAVDSAGNAYVTGCNGSTEFSDKKPIAASYGGELDGCFRIQDQCRSDQPWFSPLILAERADEGEAIALDGVDNAYVTGWTTSANFPTMNPLQPTMVAATATFRGRDQPLGSALAYSTYLGGSGGEWGYGVAVANGGNVYVTGYTTSTNFPTMNPLQPALGGVQNAFVSKLNPSG